MRATVFSYAAMIVLICIGTVSHAVVAARETSLVPGQPFVLVTTPWVNASDVIQQSGGLVLLPGRVPFVALGYSPDPEFVAIIRQKTSAEFLNVDLTGIVCS